MTGKEALALKRGFEPLGRKAVNERVAAAKLPGKELDAAYDAFAAMARARLPGETSCEYLEHFWYGDECLRGCCEFPAVVIGTRAADPAAVARGRAALAAVELHRDVPRGT